jgi:hypothetical protein
MKLSYSCLLASASFRGLDAFSTIAQNARSLTQQYATAALDFAPLTADDSDRDQVNDPSSAAGTAAFESSEAAVLTSKIISTLSFRELKRELHARGEPIEGTTSVLRQRLRSVAECVIRDGEGQEDCEIQVCGTKHRCVLLVVPCQALIRNVSFFLADGVVRQVF